MPSKKVIEVAKEWAGRYQYPWPDESDRQKESDMLATLIDERVRPLVEAAGQILASHAGINDAPVPKMASDGEMYDGVGEICIYCGASNLTDEGSCKNRECEVGALRMILEDWKVPV